jgi:ADP-ribose pyrophosphatase YjhB (NUDIX family)
MLFSDVDVPPRVVINEAIELAKTFGHKKSFKFISGVLGAVYEATGLKEKDKKSSKNKSDDDYKNAPVEGKVGAVVFSKKDENIYLAFVHDMFGYWTLSKGSLEEKDKDIESGVKRKVQEEMGIEIKVLEKLGENNYRAKSEDNKPINRAVIYFLAQSEYTDLVLEKDNKGLNNAK